MCGICFYEDWLQVRVLGYLRSEIELGQPHLGPKYWAAFKIRWAETIGPYIPSNNKNF